MMCAIYARVSTVDQSCAIQLEELRGWARRHDWPTYGEYVDHGLSGKAGVNRPALDRLLADARARRFDAVIVLKVDRFGRSMLNGIQNIKELSANGIRFIATSQNIDTDKNSPIGNLTLNIMLAFAEFERELIVERSTAGLKHARINGTRSGKPSGRPRRIFDRERARDLRAAGMSWNAVATELNIPQTTLYKALNAEPVPISEQNS